MPDNAFIGRTKPPTEAEVVEVLGRARANWDRLLSELADNLRLTEHEWKSYSPKAGWSLRVIHKKRNILYLTPYAGAFRVSLILGDKAVKAALDSGLPDAAVKLVREAKKYPEGNAIYIDVNGVKDLKIVQKLTEAKLKN